VVGRRSDRILAYRARWFIGSPLTGVDLGRRRAVAGRQHHYLRAARQLDIASAAVALDRALSRVVSFGLGAYRVIDAGDRSAALAAALADRGVASAGFSAAARRDPRARSDRGRAHALGRRCAS